MTIQQQARLAPRAHWVMLWYSLRQLPPRTFCSYQSVLSALCNTLATGHKGLLINWNVDSKTEELKNFNSSNWKVLIVSCVDLCTWASLWRSESVRSNGAGVTGAAKGSSMWVLLKTSKCSYSWGPSSGPWLSQFLDNLNIKQVAILQANASLFISCRLHLRGRKQGTRHIAYSTVLLEFACLVHPCVPSSQRSA